MNVYLSMDVMIVRVRDCSLLLFDVSPSGRSIEQSPRNPHSNEKLLLLHYIHERSFDLVQDLGIHESDDGMFHYIGSVPGNLGILHMGFEE
jgi:hypothetical protein